MDAGINNIIYMELHLGPKMVNGTCRKMIVVGTIDRGSTVFDILEPVVQSHASQINGILQNFILTGYIPFSV